MKSKSRAAKERQSHEAVAAWNTAHPVGTEVIVTRDNGDEHYGKTRGDAYVCESGYPVIFVTGILGYYLLERIRPAALTADDAEFGMSDHAPSGEDSTNG